MVVPHKRVYMDDFDVPIKINFASVSFHHENSGGGSLTGCMGNQW